MIGSLNYTKILLSASVIAFVAAAVFGGTQAFFSDEETSAGNVFAAGAIDLLVDSEQHYAGLVCNDQGVWEVENESEGTTREDLIGEPCPGTWEETDLGPEHTFFDFSDLKPGDEGENTISLHVIDNDAYMCAIIDNMQTQDNDCNEPELGAEEDAYGEGNATCGDPGMGEGELQNELHFFAWTDDGGDGFGDEEQPEEGDNIWQENEQILFENVSGPASDVIDGVVYPLYTPENGVITGSTTHYIGLYWCYGEVSTDGGELSCDGTSATNITQTDSLSADITFYAEQARNNENFECPVLEEEAVTQTGDGFAPLDRGTDNDTSWAAIGRYGNNIAESGDFEQALKETSGGTPVDQGGRVWTSGETVAWTLAYDTDTDTATWTIGGDVVSGVMSGSMGDIGITAKAPQDSGGSSVLVENVMLNGSPVGPPDSVEAVGDGASDDKEHLLISGADLSADWTLTGDVTFTWTGAAVLSDERPAFDVEVETAG